MAEFRIETERLVLREWRDCDVDALHRINSDPQVMEFIGPLQTREDALDFVAAHVSRQIEHGICYWALERRGDGALIGFCGLEPGGAGMPVEGQVEIGWRLARNCCGAGFASDAAAACLRWGFANLPFDAIFAKTVPGNLRSRRLMERLAMVYVEGADFDHPALPDGHSLRRHVLYRIDRP